MKIRSRYRRSYFRPSPVWAKYTSALYRVTYEEWLIATKNSDFPEPLRARLAQQFQIVSDYCLVRFDELYDYALGRLNLHHP